MICPYCNQETRQVKAGRNYRSGTQRYQCKHCLRHYTPEPKPHGYSDAIRQQAVKLYIDGMNLRRIGRHLGLTHQTVANWVNAHAAQLPRPPVPNQVETIEMDELHTFIEDKKTKRTSSPM